MNFLSMFKRMNKRSFSSYEFTQESQQESQSQMVTVREEMFQELFDGCSDVHTEEIHLGNGLASQSVLLVYCDGLCDMTQLYQSILPAFQQLFQTNNPQNALEVEQLSSLPIKCLGSEVQTHEIVSKVFHGALLLFFKQFQALFQLNLSNPPQRSPEDPNTEVSVRGARDGFIEELSTNVALIRKRFPSADLRYEQFTLGARTHTKVGLLYVHDIIQEDVVHDIRKRLSNVNIDTISSSAQLEELLSEKSYQLFPIFVYSGLPSFAVDSLLNGRFVIIVQGSPTAIIAPVTLSYLLKSSEDNNMLFPFVAFERALRWFGMHIALFLPGFWIALATFHQDQFPFTMVATIVVSRQGVPLPPALEAMVMLILFEVFREAGARLPMAIGQTLSVVGGLIIGQAAISAGLTAPSILVVMATSLVTQFTLVNQNLSGTISILRLAVLFISSLFGLFGFLFSIFMLITYLANIQSFGVPFLAPLSPFDGKDAIQAIFSFPWKKRKKRPEDLHPQDLTRQGGRSR